jgi:hypothetical protein
MIPRLLPYNPSKQAYWFGLFRFRSPLLTESSFLSLPPGTEMFHFPGLALTTLCIQVAVSSLQLEGLPHSDISGSTPVCGSPKLFAAYHVLHRLPMPRHPPHALSSLTITRLTLKTLQYYQILTLSVTSRFKLSKNENLDTGAVAYPAQPAQLIKARHANPDAVAPKLVPAFQRTRPVAW